ncbi:MAG TPA: hydroxymethylbilane synthase [Bryobacteraceae bacterium]|jgi:hydroxymethylbilane synthase
MLVIGSRGSALALWQANYIAARLRELGVESRIEIIKTTGDHLQTASAAVDAGKGLFTKEIEEALLAGVIDLAVHSLKDLPTELPPGLAIAAIPEREDPRDALVGHTLASLPLEARVGTSSLRRSAQLLHLRNDVRVLPIRGNVDTRLRKLRNGDYDAILLASAGLRRLGLATEIAEALSADQICCAPGQGALAVETLETGKPREICAALTHQESEVAVNCERAVLAALGGGCQLPIGAFADVTAGELNAVAVVASPDGKRLVRDRLTGSAGSPEELGRELAARLRARGADALLAALSPAVNP